MQYQQENHRQRALDLERQAWQGTPRQEFHHARTHMGAGSAGHWIKMAGILSPLVNRRTGERP